jgi:hypothetical protein
MFHSPSSREVRATVAAVATVLLSTIFSIPASAYNCTGGNGCYGTVRWNGAVDGADARISVGTMSMTSSLWHINSVLWVRDRDGVNDCSILGIPVDTAWIEVGYWARSSTQQFYWADCRAGASYYEGAFGTVTTSDKYKPNYFQIRRNTKNSTYWFVQIMAISNSWSLVSSANSMWPDQIEIGGELTGNSGASMYSGHTTNNRYIHYGSSSTPNYYYQGRDGDGKTQNPPFVSGWTAGAPDPGGTGGDWYAYCSAGAC